MPEDMKKSGIKPRDSNRGKRSQLYFKIFWGCYVLYFGVISLWNSHSSTHRFDLIFSVFLLITAPIILFPFHWFLGKIEHIQIDSPDFKMRIQQRYQSEIDQLKKLGFDQLFFVGDSRSLFSFAFILPVITTILMWRDRVPMTIQSGRRITGNPVFVSKEMNAFASQTGMGCTFRTVFQNGNILITRNFGESDDFNDSSVIVHAYKGASIFDTWSRHQYWVGMLVSESNPVNRQNSYRFYSEMVKKESRTIGLDIYKREETTP